MKSFPSDLMQLWYMISPFSQQFYSKTEIEAQRQINEKTEDGITYSPLSAEKEWTTMDFEEITPFTWKWHKVNLKIKQYGKRAIFNEIKNSYIFGYS